MNKPFVKAVVSYRFIIVKPSLWATPLPLSE